MSDPIVVHREGRHGRWCPISHEWVEGDGVAGFQHHVRVEGQPPERATGWASCGLDYADHLEAERVVTISIKAPEAGELLPAESIALTVAFAQVQRGETPSGNTATLCVLALARLAGRHDWTDQEGQTNGE